MAQKKLVPIVVSVSIGVFFNIYSVIANNYQQTYESSTVLSDAKEIELGKITDEYVRHQFYIENDPELNTSVNNIAQKLFALSDRKTIPFTCNVIQTLSINAFSAPGGYIYLTKGLLKFAKTEDEVAGVIGHEVAHLTMRHASKLYCEIMDVISREHNENGNDASVAILLMNNHLEEFEQEADTLGVFYAYKAGFNPNGLPDFLERHLNVMIHKSFYGLFRFDSYITVNSRIKHLREYISGTLVGKNEIENIKKE